MEKPMGTLIYDYCRKNNISISSLAKALNIGVSGLYRSLLAKDINYSVSAPFPKSLTTISSKIITLH
jgi:hypothetical protein